MPTENNLHFSVQCTLEKDGWNITDNTLVLVLEKILLKADIGVEKFFIANKENQKIVVRVTHLDAPPLISEL
jgi:hypothetical protein